MEQASEFDGLCERYLLGELSETEQEQFEEAYFTDDALFERFEAVKADMLDAYARGELAEDKRKRFAAHFLAASPSRRRELEDTQKFIRAVTAAAKNGSGAAVAAPVSETSRKSSRRRFFDNFFGSRPFAWQIAGAAVLLLALLVGVWFAIRQRAPIDPELAAQPTPSPTIAALVNENRNSTRDNTALTPSPTSADVNKPRANADQSPPAPEKTPTPYGAPARPPVRTTEDYLREREEKKRGDGEPR